MGLLNGRLVRKRRIAIGPFDEEPGIGRAHGCLMSDTRLHYEIYMSDARKFSRAIDEQYTAQSDSVGMVRCGSLILWENGVAISRTTDELYAAKNPYVGDMPSNGKVASIFGISDQIGPYTNELQTSAELYGWTFDFETHISAENESAAREIMAADSYEMLAAIDNLGYVTWRYTTDVGRQEYTITAEDATAFAGKDIKQCAASASELQSLIQSLNINIQRSIV